MSDGESELRASINQIADQLCQAVDGQYDFHINTSSDDLDIQKLSVLSNFVLESVRRNLTELEEVRKELQQRVEDRTRQLDLIIKGSNDGVWEWDLNRNQLKVSDRWRGMSGCEHWPECFDADDWLFRMHPDDRAPFRSAVLSHTNGITERLHIQYRLMDGRGGFRWMVARGICDRDKRAGTPQQMAGTQTDITEQKFIDSSSGLPNRDYLRLILDQRLLHEPAHCPVLIVILLSNLSLIRETLRHNEGPAFRDAIRDRLESCLKPTDLAARLDDGSPALLVADNNLDQAETRAEKVLKVFQKPIELPRRNIWLSVSAGILHTREFQDSEFQNDAGEAVLQGARTLLQRMRDNSAGQILFYEHGMHEAHRQRLNDEQLLRDAIEENWIEPFLQPLVQLHPGEVSGFEVLCRIRDPERGLISPGQFIPVAESTGLIHPLTLRLLDQLLPLLDDDAMVARYGPRFTLSLNLSPLQVQESHLADEIRGRILDSDCDPTRLKIELTETAVMDNAGAAAEVLQRFRDMGIAIALDDFGAGYSSLGLIRRLPLQQVKIDRSLVSHIDQDDEKLAILNMILSLCEQLDLIVVAEGVETEAELACLAGMGAHLVQGFLFSRPLPPGQLLEQVPARDLLPIASL